MGKIKNTILLLNLIVLTLVISLRNDFKVYIRNILFSSIHSDQESNWLEHVNSTLQSDCAKGLVKLDYSKILNSELVEDINTKKCYQHFTDRDIALTIVKNLGNPRSVRRNICGQYSFEELIKETRIGNGCCSDFSKVFILYAEYFCLQSREVSNLGHTAVEYWDSSTKKWLWLDPYNRVEIRDSKGSPIGVLEFREKMALEKYSFEPIFDDSRLSAPSNDLSYQPSQFSVLIWPRGNDYLTPQGRGSGILAKIIPKEIRQFVRLLSGVHPGYLIVANDAISFYLICFKVLIWGVIWMVCIANLVLAAIVWIQKSVFFNA
jgi:hypothetical protein